MAADGDARDAERDQEVDDDETADRAAQERHAALALEHEERAHDAEDRARRADRRRVRRHEERAEAAGERGHEVDGGEPDVAGVALEDAADQVERVHVEGEVEEAVVDERGGDQAVVLAARHGRAEERQVVPERLQRAAAEAETRRRRCS